MKKSQTRTKDGESQAFMLSWFSRRSEFENKKVQAILAKLSAEDLNILAGAVTHYGIRQSLHGGTA